MNSFWTEHWWAIPVWLLGVFALFAALMGARRNPDAKFSRMVFWLFPFLDPDSRAPPVRWRLWWLVVVVLALLLVLEH